MLPDSRDSQAPNPLWGGASRIAGARFTPKCAFDSIYLSSDPLTAFTEVSALIVMPDGPALIRSAPWVVISVDGIVQNVLDLTDGNTLTALDTNEQEMTGTWVTFKNPPTQILGQVAFDSARVAGIRYRSAKRPGGTNLMVFPDRLHLSPTNYLQVYDPHGNLNQRLE